jgi:hypothetical protein
MQPLVQKIFLTGFQTFYTILKYYRLILFMQKRISIILILIFSFSLAASGALGYADCKSKCCCQTLKMAHGQISNPMGVAEKTSFLKAAGCCSGSMAAQCKFAEGSAESLPETCPITVRSEAPEHYVIGLTSINLFIERAQPKNSARGPDPWLKTKPLPLYLQKLTFLC